MSSDVVGHVDPDPHYGRPPGYGNWIQEVKLKYAKKCRKLKKKIKTFVLNLRFILSNEILQKLYNKYYISTRTLYDIKLL